MLTKEPRNNNDSILSTFGKIVSSLYKFVGEASLVSLPTTADNLENTSSRPVRLN
jgi:hypothetical protein